MKAVIWHADATPIVPVPDGVYEFLFKKFKEQIYTIHLTTHNHPEWGDETYHYGFPAEEVVKSRERAFSKFLSEAPEDVYWFTEPDVRLRCEFPPLKEDLALLYRDDSVHLTPSFRLARPSALPIFEWVRDAMDGKRADWHGDSSAWNDLYEELGHPKGGVIEAMGCRIEIRDYLQYNAFHSQRNKNVYAFHSKAGNKTSLAIEEGFGTS